MKKLLLSLEILFLHEQFFYLGLFWFQFFLQLKVLLLFLLEFVIHAHQLFLAVHSCLSQIFFILGKSVLQGVHMRIILCHISLLLILQLSYNNRIGCINSTQYFPSDRTEYNFSQCGADWRKNDHIGIVQVWAHSDEKDDFWYLDEEGVLVASFCL